MGLIAEPDIRSSDARILYAEDDADTRVLVSYLLSRAGYEVVVAANPEQFARLTLIGSFDLYQLDNWIPGGSGNELCGWGRKFDKDTSILFYSVPLMNRTSVLH